MNDKLAIWNDSTKIKELFAPKLTSEEFDFFLGLGRGLGANPFNREIWAVKYRSDQPASIFLGRDFYRRKAQEQEDYDGHIVDSVYSKDHYSVKNGEVDHSYNMNGERGDLVGAYCVVRKKNLSQPYYIFARLDEYQKGTGNPIWSNKPDTMIKKVAEAQGLRGAYQGVFAGTYDESEQWNVEKVENQMPKSLPEKLDEEVKESTKKRKKEIEPKTENLITEGMAKNLHISATYKFETTQEAEKYIDDWLLHFNLKSTKELTVSQFEEIKADINKKKDF